VTKDNIKIQDKNVGLMRIDLDTPESEHSHSELNFPKINGLNSTFMDTTTKMMTGDTGLTGTADSFEK
jgi:hypothetical protein